MERYKEISLADVFEMITKNELDDIYFKSNDTGSLLKARRDKWYFSELAKTKWFKREVIE